MVFYVCWLSKTESRQRNSNLPVRAHSSEAIQSAYDRLVAGSNPAEPTIYWLHDYKRVQKLDIIMSIYFFTY